MKLALIGYGKMGKTIEALVEKKYSKSTEISTKVFLGSADSLSADALKGADVAIDFSAPNAVMDNIKSCLDQGVPIVVGTTGWYSHLPTVKQWVADKNGSLFYASNFSVGMNILFNLNKQLAKTMNALEHYDVEIVETHHTEKLDSPSGTAITLADEIIWGLNRKEKWENEENDDDETLSIISHRKADVKGTHDIIYRSGIDELTLRHKAFSRDGFADGAIKAAKWLKGKKGIYTMSDMMQ